MVVTEMISLFFLDDGGSFEEGATSAAVEGVK